MKTSICIFAYSLLFALAFLSQAFGQDYIRFDEHDKRGNEVTVYRDAVTSVAKRVWHHQRLDLTVFDSSLVDSDGSFIGMAAVDQAMVEQIVPKIFRFYDTLLKIDPEAFTKRQIETDGEKWYITYKQVYDGIPVYRAEAGLTIDEFGQIIAIGSNAIPDLDVSTTPSVTEANATDIALKQVRTVATDSVSIRSKPELAIYPERSDTEVKSYLAYQVDAMNHTHYTGKRVFVDAHSGSVVAETDLFKHSSKSIRGNKTIQGNFSGRYWPKDINSTQATDFPKYYQQLKVTNSLGQTVGTGYLDANGDYSITWNGATGTYWLHFALKGSFAEVTNVPNNTPSFFVSGTTTFNRQFTADQEAYNLYFHMNKIHDWFKASPFNYNGMDYSMKGTAYAGAGINGQADGTDISFGTQNGNLWHSQSDGIYHEYTHNVVFHIYGDWIDPANNNGQADAMDEAIPDYFATSLADDPWRPLVQRNVATPDLDMNDFDAINNTPHQNGLILAGACWDLQKDGGISEDDARELAFKAMQLTPRPDTFQEFVDNVILQDDDNGKLCDETPHYDEIIAAFETKHGIVPTLNIPALCPPSNLTITNAGNLGENPDLSWNASATATSYKIYRCVTNSIQSCQYEFIGSTTNTSYTDVMIVIRNSGQSDDTFHWQVSAVNSEGESARSNTVSTIGEQELFKEASDSEVVPEKFALHQNYPNPFNPSTEIRYELPENSRVSLSVFNLVGQKVRTLVEATQSPGYYNIVWDGKNDSGEQVTSGVYLYKIIVISENDANQFIRVKKMSFVQ